MLQRSAVRSRGLHLVAGAHGKVFGRAGWLHVPLKRLRLAYRKRQGMGQGSSIFNGFVSSARIADVINGHLHTESDCGGQLQD